MTLSNNIPPLDEVDDGEKFSTCLVLNFCSCSSPYASVSTISCITQYSASSISIGYQHIYEIGEAIEGVRYNRLTRGYCSGSLPNVKIHLKRSLWFYKGCNRFNNKTYYFQQVGRDFFVMNHDSLVRLP